MKAVHVVVAALLTTALMIVAFKLGSQLRIGGFMAAMMVFVGAIWLFASKDR